MRLSICIAMLGTCCNASIISRIFHRGASEKETTDFLPQLLPQDETAYLVSFESDDYDHCRQMHPVLRRLEDDLGTIVRRINIARRREFMGLLEAMGHNDCGTLPFYYNRRTGQAICGATTYRNLVRWGTGDLKHNFMDPPESVVQANDNNIGPSSRKGVGTQGFFMDRLQALERRGKEQTDAALKVAEARKMRMKKKQDAGGKTK